jgi:glucose-1-phosphatase
MIKAIIWDLGGVILRTHDHNPREKLAAELGKNRQDIEYLLFAGESSVLAQSGMISWQEHLDHVREELGLTPSALEDFLSMFWAGDRFDEELINYIRKLKKRYKTGLLSNAFENLRKLLEENWLAADAFDKIIVSAEVGMMKPDARIFQLMLQELDVDASEAVFIDDFIQNIEGAQTVGLQAIHFKSPEQARRELEIILNGDLE